MGALTPGVVLGGCRIDAVVGSGGMGIVYRARQLALDRDVAVKVIAPELVEDPGSRRRFLTEARAASVVEHPNVLPVHGAGVDDGRAYIVMRYVAGENLRTLVRREGALAPDRAAEIVLLLGDALDAIHRAGYVHRDVKPQNVLLDAEGHVYLSDFGLAKQALATGGPTSSEGWVGTLDYVAPEQIRGERVDARADIYALGGVLHFTLTGHVPYERPSDHAKLWAHLVDEPPRPSAVRARLPARFDSIVARAMAKDPADRYPSAGDLGRAAAGMTGASAEQTVAIGDAAPSAVTTVRARRVRPRRRRVMLAFAVLLAAAAGATALLATRDQPRERASTSPQPVPTARPSGPHVTRTIPRVGERPRAVEVAGGAVWVLSTHEPRITRIDPDTGRRLDVQPHIGRGAADIASDRGIVWIAKRATSAVLGLDARSGDLVKRIQTPLPAVRVAAGRSGLWVVARESGEGPALLLRYDRAGSQLSVPMEFAEGIEAIATGAGALWVALPTEPRITRVEPDGTQRVGAWLSHPASELAFGAERLWATVPDDESLARIHPRNRRAPTTAVDARPAGLTVAGDHVFVAGYTTHELIVVDPERMRRTVARLRMPTNPYAVTTGAGHVWVTGLGKNTLTRVDYRSSLP